MYLTILQRVNLPLFLEAAKALGCRIREPKDGLTYILERGEGRELKRLVLSKKQFSLFKDLKNLYNIFRD